MRRGEAFRNSQGNPRAAARPLSLRDRVKSSQDFTFAAAPFD
jgi:hypothetical protein